MLEFEIDMPVSRGGKSHKAEKPVELYRYLIENLTDEREVVLDQFGGSCNCAQAATLSNRFGVVFETCREYVESAVKRFCAVAAGVVTATTNGVGVAQPYDRPNASVSVGCQLTLAV